jgi:macrocin-O-methyltransferase TylF-like protien
MNTVDQRRRDLAKSNPFRRLWTGWRRGRRANAEMSAKAIVDLASEHGYFVAKARDDCVYVPRKRVADDKATPLILDRDLEVFFEIADKVVSDGCTMMPYERLFTLWQALVNTRHIGGSGMAEIGVWRGGSSYLLAQGRKRLTGMEAPLISIDTFEGHPGDTLDAELDPHQRAGGFAATSVKRVRRYLAEFSACEVVQGEATKVLPSLSNRSYFLVHIDTDIHASTAECLRYFHSRLVPGGIIVVDDFGAKRCPGVAKAVHDHLPNMGDCQVWQMRCEQCIITKVSP